MGLRLRTRALALSFAPRGRDETARLKKEFSPKKVLTKYDAGPHMMLPSFFHHNLRNLRFVFAEHNLAHQRLLKQLSERDSNNTLCGFLWKTGISRRGQY